MKFYKVCRGHEEPKSEDVFESVFHGQAWGYYSSLMFIVLHLLVNCRQLAWPASFPTVLCAHCISLYCKYDVNSKEDASFEAFLQDWSIFQYLQAARL